MRRPARRPMPQPAAEKPAPGAPPGLYLSAGTWASSATLDNPVHWRITKAGADGALVRDIRASSLFEKLEPGTYEVEAQPWSRAGAPDGRGRCRYGDAGARRPQRRRPQDAGARRRHDGAADLRHIHGRTRRAPKRAQAAPIWVGRDAHPEIVIPAGEYSVTAQNGLARQQSKVTIAPATGTSFNSMLQSGIARAQRHARRRRRPGRARDRRRDLHPLAGRSRRAAGPPRGGTLGGARADIHAARRHLLRDGADIERGSARAARHRRRGMRQARRAAGAGAHQAGRHARRTAADTGQPDDLPHRAPRRRAARDRPHHRQGAGVRSFRRAAIASRPCSAAATSSRRPRWRWPLGRRRRSRWRSKAAASP